MVGLVSLRNNIDSSVNRCIRVNCASRCGIVSAGHLRGLLWHVAAVAVFLGTGILILRRSDSEHVLDFRGVYLMLFVCNARSNVLVQATVGLIWLCRHRPLCPQVPLRNWTSWRAAPPRAIWAQETLGSDGLAGGNVRALKTRRRVFCSLPEAPVCDLVVLSDLDMIEQFSCMHNRPR